MIKAMPHILAKLSFTARSCCSGVRCGCIPPLEISDNCSAKRSRSALSRAFSSSISGAFVAWARNRMRSRRSASERALEVFDASARRWFSRRNCSAASLKAAFSVSNRLSLACCHNSSAVAAMISAAAPALAWSFFHSHSIVLGGLLEISKHTRLTPLTSLMIRVLIRAIKS